MCFELPLRQVAVKKVNKVLKLFSFSFFIGSITFIAIKSTPAGSTEQVIAAAFAAIVGMVFHGEWETFSDNNYWQAIGFAATLVLGWIGYNKYLASK